MNQKGMSSLKPFLLATCCFQHEGLFVAIMDNPSPQIVRGLETELLQPEVRSNPARVAELLADEFTEFGESGKRYSKHDTLAALGKPADVKYSILDFSAIEISSGVVLATYRVQKEDLKSGRTTLSLRNSLWRYRDKRWQMVFHQGTPLLQG